MDKRQEIEKQNKPVVITVCLSLAILMLITSIVLIFLKLYYAAMIPLLAMIILAIWGVLVNSSSLKSFDADYRKYISEKETEEKKRLAAQRVKDEKAKKVETTKQKDSRKKKKGKRKNRTYAMKPAAVAENSSCVKDTEIAAKEESVVETKSVSETTSSESGTNDNVIVIAEPGEGKSHPILTADIKSDIDETNSTESVDESISDASEDFSKTEQPKPASFKVKSVQPKKDIETHKLSSTGKKIKQLNAKPKEPKEVQPETNDVPKVSQKKIIVETFKPAEPIIAEEDTTQESSANARPLPNIATKSSIIDVVYLGALVDHIDYDNVVLMFYTDKFLVRSEETLFEGRYVDVNMLAYNEDAPSIALSCRGFDGKRHTFVSDDADDGATMKQIFEVVRTRVNQSAIV